MAKKAAEKILLKPTQQRSVATKQKIKKASRKLISKLGYYTVTSNMIAKEAGVPIGSFYNYFGNKEGVLLELIKDFNADYHQETLPHLEDIISNVRRKSDIMDGIERLLTISILNKHLSTPFYRIIHALQFTEKKVLKLSEEMREIELEGILLFLNRINEFCPIDNLPEKAMLIHSSGESICLYIHHLGTGLDKEKLLSETAKMIHGYLT